MLLQPLKFLKSHEHIVLKYIAKQQYVKVLRTDDEDVWLNIIRFKFAEEKKNISIPFCFVFWGVLVICPSFWIWQKNSDTGYFIHTTKHDSTHHAVYRCSSSWFNLNFLHARKTKWKYYSFIWWWNIVCEVNYSTRTNKNQCIRLCRRWLCAVVATMVNQRFLSFSLLMILSPSSFLYTAVCAFALLVLQHFGFCELATVVCAVLFLFTYI